MADISRVTLSGRVCTDPIFNDGDHKNVYFRLAQNKFNKDSQFISIKGWDDIAERISKYVKKGSSIVLWGRLDISTYNEKERMEVVVEGFEFFGGGGKSKPQNEGVDREESMATAINSEMPF